MLIRYHGHAEFLMETEKGQRILTDPFDPRVPYPQKEVAAELVTISHGHDDHGYLTKVKGAPAVLRERGEHEPLQGVSITGWPSYHDDQQGALRGENTIYVFEAEGLRVAHAGDLGSEPNAQAMAALQGLDILMLPVGGTYTLDASQAAALCRKIRPRIIIPMHFKKGEQGFQHIGTLEMFLDKLAPMSPSFQPLLRVTKEDISEAAPLVVLEAG